MKKNIEITIKVFILLLIWIDPVGLMVKWLSENHKLAFLLKLILFPLIPLLNLISPKLMLYFILGTKMIELPVYTQPYSTDKYLYQKDLPAMTENTICFWFWSHIKSGDNFRGIVSVATPGRLCNLFFLTLRLGKIM